MAEVEVSINGRSYPIACEDGQEEHVARLAAYVDKRASELVSDVGQVSNPQLLIMVGLLVADELSEAHDEIERLKDEAKRAEATGRQAAATDLDAAFASTVERLAQRVEAIAANLESD